VEGWTDMNAVVYHGNSESRKLIEQHEFFFGDEGGGDDDEDDAGSTDPSGRRDSTRAHPVLFCFCICLHVCSLSLCLFFLSLSSYASLCHGPEPWVSSYYIDCV
jgi:hypothetical protein